MRKRIFSCMLALCMLAGMFSVTAFAESDYKYSKIAYYKDGSEVTGLTSGEITAKVKVKSAGSTDTLFFAMLLYKNNELTAAAVDEDAPAVAATAVTYEAKITVPSDLTGVKLVSVLWKDVKGMEPICSSSIVPSKETGLESLTVDGVAIEGFALDKYEYDVKLTDTQIARASAPWVGYSAFDNGVNVEVTDPVEFPGASTVKVTASDNETSVTYTINYKYEGTLASLVEIVSSNSDGKIGGVAADKAVVVKSNFSAGDVAPLGNRALRLGNADESLIGLDYVTGAAGGLKSKTIALKRGATLSAFIQECFGEKGKEVFSGWKWDNKGWDRSIKNNWTGKADHEPIGEVGDGLNDFPGVTGDDIPSNMREAYMNSQYDVTAQGWLYHDYRHNADGSGFQDYRAHKWCALTYKFTKAFEASTFDENGNATGGTITIDDSKFADWGVPVFIEWNNWEPAVNPDADLAL